MIYTVLSGTLWIAGGVLSCLASTKKDNIWTMISAGIFLIVYLIFIGFFGAVMVQINTYNIEVLDKECSEVRSNLRQSGDMFVVWSVLSFVLGSHTVVLIIISIFS